MNIQKLCFSLDNGDTGFKVRRLDIGQQSPLKAGTKPVFQGFNLFWGPVRGQNNLLFCLVKGIKGVEKFFLRLILAADKLDVVY